MTTRSRARGQAANTPGSYRWGEALDCRRVARWRRTALILRLLLLAGLVWLALMVVSVGAPGWLVSDDGRRDSLLVACLVYAALLAVPFIPAVEIGLLIMVVFGQAGAVGAYLATVVGLNLAYVVGRVLGRGLIPDDMHAPPGVSARLQSLARRVSGERLPIVALALLLNLPGGMLVGGGGGVALVYGATRMLYWPAFAATVAVATALLPAIFLMGAPGMTPLLVDGQ